MVFTKVQVILKVGNLESKFLQRECSLLPCNLCVLMQAAATQNWFQDDDCIGQVNFWLMLTPKNKLPSSACRQGLHISLKFTQEV